mgnify:CR=1 FL=1
MQNLSNLESKLLLKFNNQDLLLQALTHRSYLNENPSFRVGQNERLEFLGDAVLELVVTEVLFQQFHSLMSYIGRRHSNLAVSIYFEMRNVSKG